MIRRLAFCLLAFGTWAAPASAATSQSDVYALTKGCYALQPGGDGFRFQATRLGSYLLYDKDRRFLTAKPGGTERAAEPSAAADWKVTPAGDGFRFEAGGKTLEDGRAITLTRAEGCPVYPEVDTSVAGQPLRQPTPFGEQRGLIDLHMHMMAFEFLGGAAHCGRPWHPYGAPYALVDCPDHRQANGGAAILENTVSYGNPVGQHDPIGWPTFRDWPHRSSLTHEQSYWKWMERAWMGGLRVMVNLFVDNAALCKIYPYKANRPEPCHEMSTVRLQHRRILELQDYIDAQAGGPGKGFFRIVTDPFEARQVIADGKLAVVLGIEISSLFDCGRKDDVAQCDRRQVDNQLDEVHRMGVRDLELVNKFDNGFSGVAGDAGEVGVLVNNANKLETNRYWAMQTCTGDPNATDREQLTPATGQNAQQDQIFGNAARLLPQGSLPLYPRGPHCNDLGLTQLGEYLVNKMIDKGMIIDPDHQSVSGRNGTLALAEARDYSGVVSSHSWSDPTANPRIYKLGGVISPMAGSAKTFVEEWKKIRPLRDPRYFFGFGYGADMNGFAHQGEPRAGDNAVTYPFTSFDGGVTVDRQRSGERVFDYTADGMAHYGMFPDWVEDLRKLAGPEIVDDMARGTEAYLQMWERAEGIPVSQCRAPHLDANRAGLGGVALGATTRQVLQRASQPRERGSRAWKWCIRARGNRDKAVTGVLTPAGRMGLVGSDARGHRARGVGPGARVSKLRAKKARSFGRGVRVRNAGGGTKMVWVVRRGRVRYVAAASREASRTRGALRSYLRLAGAIR